MKDKRIESHHHFSLRTSSSIILLVFGWSLQCHRIVVSSANIVNSPRISRLYTTETMLHQGRALTYTTCNISPVADFPEPLQGQVSEAVTLEISQHYFVIHTVKGRKAFDKSQNTAAPLQLPRHSASYKDSSEMQVLHHLYFYCFENQTIFETVGSSKMGRNLDGSS